MRDVADSPPAGWSIERQRDYFDWGKAVIDGLPRVNAKLLELFVEAARAEAVTRNLPIHEYYRRVA